MAATRILCAVLVLMWLAVPQAQRGASRVTAIVGARLIDGTGAPPVENSAVLVQGDRITAAGPRARVQVPKDATVIDASGKSLIPGLIDAHYHLYHLNQPPDEMKRMFLVSLAWGVTTFRSIGTDSRQVVPLYHAVQRGEVPGPRVYTAGQGFLKELPNSAYPALTPKTPEEARAQVRDLKAQKVNFVKIWMRGTHLPPDIVSAIIDEAKKQGLPMVVHVTEQATLHQIADQGVTDIMHEPIDKPITPELIAYIKSKNLTFIPTIANSEASYYYVEHPEYLKKPPKFDGFYAGGRARYLDPEHRKTVLGNPNLAQRKASVRAMLPFVKTMYDNGVRVIVGSDGGSSGETTPIGHATHREMQLFVEAGLPPVAAIRAATLDAARLLERTENPGYGSVQAGKIADLVLVDGNPAASISDTEKINRVMQAGKWVP
jgi:imidazolonepropionase-like amidohydrolase